MTFFKNSKDLNKSFKKIAELRGEKRDAAISERVRRWSISLSQSEDMKASAQLESDTIFTAAADLLHKGSIPIMKCDEDIYVEALKEKRNKRQRPTSFDRPHKYQEFVKESNERRSNIEEACKQR